MRQGVRLFDEGESPIPLTLLSSETFSTGVLNLVYGPSDGPAEAGYEEARTNLAAG
jgi:hypothetical protein